MRLFGQILQELDTVSKLAQKDNVNVSEITSLIQQTLENLSATRKNYVDVKNVAADIAVKWDVNAVFKNKRQTKIKKHYYELCEDFRFRTCYIQK